MLVRTSCSVLSTAWQALLRSLVVVQVVWASLPDQSIIVLTLDHGCVVTVTAELPTLTPNVAATIVLLLVPTAMPMLSKLLLSFNLVL